MSFIMQRSCSLDNGFKARFNGTGLPEISNFCLFELFGKICKQKKNYEITIRKVTTKNILNYTFLFFSGEVFVDVSLVSAVSCRRFLGLLLNPSMARVGVASKHYFQKSIQ